MAILKEDQSLPNVTQPLVLPEPVVVATPSAQHCHAWSDYYQVFVLSVLFARFQKASAVEDLSTLGRTN
ncbi:hypothetical protein [Methylobacter sp. YRD-M1]|uniref:hypothetical protein n=1 Tax=Methylobacter sp. YRD-M1 TaxID=2911520 RepID=UPI00227BBF13|nr:hypothetical protein [Methylobacter sp. YRD-M1]WAK03799.1 hypothetical protein LZ558_08455 [Methylobacter sp. YRD-M1]